MYIKINLYCIAKNPTETIIKIKQIISLVSCKTLLKKHHLMLLRLQKVYSKEKQTKHNYGSADFHYDTIIEMTATHFTYTTRHSYSKILKNYAIIRHMNSLKT